MQKSQRPHIVAEHQWYKKENDTKKQKNKHPNKLRGPAPKKRPMIFG